ncbi:hypothetical protein CERZMDRAFT_88468 [Cercospora zeae-maydis SCOH1-5]|uniref:Uncharacterized protein n=1 Tax=Cercospora zeae-maydis SCOH1-5 TaxID=717836 RepID=A0A6A6F289_9PEZI|nr:hypothetical protein CERZMDRAFT_88468 [Cercospora zeae-maydis SCOH1-5]
MLDADRQILGSDFGNEPTITDERRNEDDFDIEYFVKGHESDQGEWTRDSKLSRAAVQKWKVAKQANSTDPFANTTSLLDHDDRDRELHTSNNNAQEYFQDGFWALSALTWDAASRHKIVQDTEHDIDSWTSFVTILLCMTEYKVVKALCGPGLRWSKLRDPELLQKLNNLRESAVSRPCHYVIEFVHKHGNGPTVGEMRGIIKATRDYLEVDDPTDAQAKLAVRVDGWDCVLLQHQQDNIWYGGKRRYLFSDGKSLEDTRDTRRPKILEFLEQLEALLEDFADDDQMPFLLKDVGYTVNGDPRLAQRESHTSSNAIMNLIEAVSIALFGEDKYRMKGDVMFICGLPEQAEAGEVFWSLLCDSYTWTGRGFNGVDAGNNQVSMKYHRNYRLWPPRDAEAYNDGPFLRTWSESPTPEHLIWKRWLACATKLPISGGGTGKKSRTCVLRLLVSKSRRNDWLYSWKSMRTSRANDPDDRTVH